MTFPNKNEPTQNDLSDRSDSTDLFQALIDKGGKEFLMNLVPYIGLSLLILALTQFAKVLGH